MKRYQITDPKYFTTSRGRFNIEVLKSYMRHKPDFIVFRDKKASLKEKKRVLKDLIKIGKRAKTKIIINEDIRLAKKFHLGVHLTSKQFKKIRQCKREKMFVVVSTHSAKEFEYVVKKGANLATFSPIFSTPDKGKPKGIESLNLINDKIKTKLIALGGITTKDHIKKLRGSGIFGFASIRYFVK